jgi:hypothetical protein
MTYHCGIGPGLGIEARDPSVTCDGDSCLAFIVAGLKCPAWLRKGIAPPGWLKVPNDPEGFTSSHYCPTCRKKRAALASEPARGEGGRR